MMYESFAGRIAPGDTQTVPRAQQFIKINNGVLDEKASYFAAGDTEVDNKGGPKSPMAIEHLVFPPGEEIYPGY